MSNDLKTSFVLALKGLTVLALIAAAIAAIYGWINNIVTLAMHTPEMGTEFILRLVGVFVGPLGAIMGLFV